MNCGDVNIKLKNYNLVVNLKLFCTSVGGMCDLAILTPRNAFDKIFEGMGKGDSKISRQYYRINLSFILYECKYVWPSRRHHN